MSGAQLAGDVVDAALLAGAIDHEGGTAGAADGHTHETTCLNCGALLAGAYCHECGQAAHVHRTLGAFFHDLLHGVFHFEGRIWHTLPLLVLRPGQLTRRYIDGQRARFVSPLALFLFCVFLMFAAIQQTSHDDPVGHGGGKAKVMVDKVPLNTRLAQLRAERSALVARHADTEDVDAEIASLQPIAAALQAGPAQPNGAAPVTTGIKPIDAIVAKVKENPELVLYKLEMHAYKYSWLLIPISVPFVWLLFPFDRRFPLYDHTVFVTYSLGFMTLLSVVMIVAGTLEWDWAVVLLVFVPPLHMYRQLRGAYGCSRAGAVLRTVGLLMIAGIAMLIFTGVIVAESTDMPILSVSA